MISKKDLDYYLTNHENSAHFSHAPHNHKIAIKDKKIFYQLHHVTYEYRPILYFTVNLKTKIISEQQWTSKEWEKVKNGGCIPGFITRKLAENSLKMVGSQPKISLFSEKHTISTHVTQQKQQVTSYHTLEACNRLLLLQEAIGKYITAKTLAASDDHCDNSPAIEDIETQFLEALSKLKALEIAQTISLPEIDKAKFFTTKGHMIIFNKSIGKYSDVYEANLADKIVAVKIFHAPQLQQRSLDEFKNDIRILEHIQHPNIVAYLDAIIAPPHLGLVMELMPQKSLYDAFQNNILLTPRQRFNIAMDAIYGLSTLHGKNIIHCDLKSTKLLLDSNLRAKWADFGLSILHTYSIDIASNSGILRWKAPELLNSGPIYSKASDIYSLGLTLWGIYSELIPYQSCQEDTIIIESIQKGDHPDLNFITHPKIFSIAQSCLCVLPEKRITIEKAVAQVTLSCIPDFESPTLIEAIVDTTQSFKKERQLAWELFLKEISYIVIDAKRAISIFISYAWPRDPHECSILQSRLKLLKLHLETTGAKVYLDLTDLRSNIPEYMNNIRQSDAIILVGTPILKSRLEEIDMNNAKFEYELIKEKLATYPNAIFPLLLSGRFETSFPAEILKNILIRTLPHFTTSNETNYEIYCKSLTDLAQLGLIPALYGFNDNNCSDVKKDYQRAYYSWENKFHEISRNEANEKHFSNAEIEKQNGFHEAAFKSYIDGELRGHDPCCYRIATYYLLGKILLKDNFVDYNPTLAEKYFRVGAERGNLQCMQRLAELLANRAPEGQEPIKIFEEAIYWIEQVYEKISFEKKEQIMIVSIKVKQKKLQYEAEFDDNSSAMIQLAEYLLGSKSAQFHKTSKKKLEDFQSAMIFAEKARSKGQSEAGALLDKINKLAAGY